MSLYFKFKLWLDDTASDVGYSKRFTAYLIDWFLGALVMMFPMCLIWMFYTHDMENMAPLDIWMIRDTLSIQMAILAGCISVIFSILYYVFVPYKVYPGQTIGKRVMGLKIVTKEDQDVTLRTLIIRQVLGFMIVEGTFYNVTTLMRNLLSMIIGLNLTGILMYQELIVSVISVAVCMFSNSHRMIHDRLANTKVVLYGGE